MADPESRSGRRYKDSAIERYVDTVHAAHDAALASAFDAPDRLGLPAIQLSPSEGRLLCVLLKAIGARRVIELGTLTGYSALWIARALPPDGQLVTVEANPEHADVARQHLADVADRVEVRVGKALDVLPTLEATGPFDAMFIDADKGNYDAYAEWAARLVRPGGLLIADNVYLFGNLLDSSPDATAMRRMHESVGQSFDTACIPTPDGLLLGVRRN